VALLDSNAIARLSKALTKLLTDCYTVFQWPMINGNG